MAMRVLHVVPTVSTQAGSIGLLLPGLVEALEFAGVHSQMVAAEARLGGDAEPGPSGASEYLPMAADLGDAVERADVVHFHGWGYEGVRRVVRAVRNAGKGFVASPLGALLDGPHRRPAWQAAWDRWFGVRRLARAAGAILALNGHEAAELRKAGFAEQTRVLPYGHRFSESPPSSTAEGSLPAGAPGRCLLVLGPLDPVEGCVPLLKAFAELGADANEWHLVFAGQDLGQWRHVLEPAVRRKGGDGRVRFEPASDDAMQRAWLTRASLLVTPSLVVRAPVSLLQAIAVGVPVLATRCVVPDALSEFVQSCSAERAALRDALRAMLRRPEAERQERARAARARAAASLDWRVLAPRYIEEYERIVRAGRHSAGAGAVAA